MIGFQRFLEVWGNFLRFAVHQGPRIWTNYIINKVKVSKIKR